MSIEFQPGDIIADRYRVVGEVGSGGMGVVLAGEHVQLGKKVAIKVMSDQADPTALQRFTREAQALARLSNPHVCQVLDMGSLPSGEPFMVMELLEGKDLQDLADAGKIFRVDEMVDFILAASEALAEAHAQRIVHRDLKPSNIFLARQADGTHTVKLIDFGIAKAVGETTKPNLTKTDTLVGSPAFMAPEQLMANTPIDARTDIWALGVVMYELLARRSAFDGDAVAQIFMSILQGEPAPMHHTRSDLPTGFEPALRRCIKKQPSDRYQDLGEMARALAPFGSDRAHRSLATIERLLAQAPSAAATAAAAAWPHGRGANVLQTGTTPVVGTQLQHHPEFAQLSATIGYDTGNVAPPDSTELRGMPSSGGPVSAHAPSPPPSGPSGSHGPYSGGPATPYQGSAGYGPPSAQTPHSAGPHGAGPHGAGPHGAGPHGAGSHGAGPHGAAGANQAYPDAAPGPVAHSTTDGMASMQPARAASSRKWLPAMVGVAAVLALGGLGFAWSQSRAVPAADGEPNPASAAQPTSASPTAPSVPLPTSEPHPHVVDDASSSTAAPSSEAPPRPASPPPVATDRPPSAQPPPKPNPKTEAPPAPKPDAEPPPPEPKDPIGF